MNENKDGWPQREKGKRKEIKKRKSEIERERTGEKKRLP